MMSAKKSLLNTLLTISLMMGYFVFGVNAEQQQRVLILPFHNISEDILAKDLQENIPALLEVFFSQSDRYTLVDRGHLDHIIEEQTMALTWPVPEEQRPAPGKILQASIMISGGFIKDEQRIPANKLMSLNVEYGEVDVGRRIKAAGGKWDRREKVWKLAYQKVEALGMLDRITYDGPHEEMYEG